MTEFIDICPHIVGTRPRHLLHVLPGFGVGGMEVRVARLISQFGLRFRHSIVALNGITTCAGRIEGDAAYSLVEVPVWKSRPVRTLMRFRRELDRRRPDLLLTYNWGAIEWALVNLLRPVCPHLHAEDGFGAEEAEAQLPRRIWMRRLALSRSRRIVVPSRKLETIARTVWKLPPQRVLYVPNGIDLARFAAAPEPQALPGGPRRDGELVVGTLAGLRPEKNLHRMIRAFATLPANTRLVILGEGAQRAALQHLAGALGIAERVVMPGMVAAPERVLGLFDVYCISSDTEQMPISLLEAMAARLPVASLDLGDVKDMLAPENAALIAPAGDEAALAGVLARLLRDADLRAALGAANREAVCRNFSQERMFATYLDLYSQ